MATPNPHDHYIRGFFSKPENAVELFRNCLPGHVFALLDPETLRLTESGFIDEDQSESRADLLFQIGFKSGSNNLQVYCLFEHKSYLDKKIYIQLLKYLSRVYERQFTEFGKLYPVIPLVLYHGKQDWSLGNRFADQFDHLMPESLALLQPFLPDFQIQLLNLPKQDIKTSKMAAMVKMMLGFVKHIESAAFDEHLMEFLKLHRSIKDRQKVIDFLIETLYYLYSVKEIRPESIKKVLHNVQFEQSEYEAIVMTTADKLREEGIEQGIEQGIERGIEQGIRQKALEDARLMKTKGYPDADIIEITGLSKEELEKAGILE